MSNSLDPDEPSHLDLCCLQKSIIVACGSERVNDTSVIVHHFVLSPREMGRSANKGQARKSGRKMMEKVSDGVEEMEENTNYNIFLSHRCSRSFATTVSPFFRVDPFSEGRQFSQELALLPPDMY